MSLLPKGLTGRTVLVLLAAVALVHFGSMLIYERGLIHGVMPWHERPEPETRQRLEAAWRIIGREPRSERAAVAALLSSEDFIVQWSPQPQATAVPISSIRAAIERSGAITLEDGTTLQFELVPDPHVGHETHATLLSTTVMVLGVLAVAALLVRSIAAPLRRLARAADAIGHRIETAPVSEEGPNEVRQVARALNAMQQRIAHLIADRTQALAAVSHDLRTPITRLRLQAGFIAERDVQYSIDRDLDEMEAMIDSTLAYLRGELETEPPRPTDLPALLETLVDAEEDQGHIASYDGPPYLTAIVRPVALKRAFANLIVNAISYGGMAAVRLRLEPESVVITIDDEGPGIPERELERVFDPFVRLETSRNCSTGGVGLGLTIARQAITNEGGMLILVNRPTGGLTAQVTLPLHLIAAPSVTRGAAYDDNKADRRTASGPRGETSPEPVISNLPSSLEATRDAH